VPKRVFKKTYFLREIIRYLPRKRHIQGSWVHRLVGERLFSSKLWKFSRDQVAKGLALGIFIALTPTIGVQMAMTVVAAFILRVNIPVAVAACWITNPLTAPFIYTLQYRLGIWLVGVARPEELYGYAGMMKNMMRHAKPLWAGSLMSALLFSALAYGVVWLCWGCIPKAMPGSDEKEKGRDEIPSSITAISSHTSKKECEKEILSNTHPRQSGKSRRSLMAMNK
jgi:uncharacterized protein (DUF2062 family)